MTGALQKNIFVNHSNSRHTRAESTIPEVYRFQSDGAVPHPRSEALGWDGRGVRYLISPADGPEGRPREARILEETQTCTGGHGGDRMEEWRGDLGLVRRAYRAGRAGGKCN